MANAKQCERCGRFYKLTDTPLDPTQLNTLKTAYTDRHGLVVDLKLIDLCPTCVKAFKEFMEIQNEG